MNSTKDLIEEAREMASSCSPLVTAMLNTMADELERLPLADALAYTAACTDIECNAVMAKRSRQEGAGKVFSKSRAVQAWSSVFTLARRLKRLSWQCSPTPVMTTGA